MADGRALRVLVVDDERPARQKIRRFLADLPDVGDVTEAEDVEAARRAIDAEAPDIVFLDVRMPGASGLDLARSLPAGSAPHVVFVTAHDRHAVDAFDLDAIDFLLKPFDRERFRRAFERAVAAVGDARHEPAARLLVEQGTRTLALPLDDVIRIETERNYLRVHVRGGVSHRMRGTLAALLTRLDPARFVRINRGLAVHRAWVGSMRVIGHGDAELRLKDGSMVRVGRRYRDALRPGD